MEGSTIIMTTTTEFTSPHEANKYYREKLRTNGTLEAILRLWVDMAFKGRHLVLSGLPDQKDLRFWVDLFDELHLEEYMRLFMMDMLLYGRFGAHMLMDEKKGHWTDIVMLDADYYSLRFSLMGSQPRLALHPTEQERWWANTTDPRVVEQRTSRDPKLIELLAKGEPLMLEPENTLFLARGTQDGTDFYGRSVLADLEEKDYESPQQLAYALGAFYNPVSTKLRKDLSSYVIKQKIVLPLSRKLGHPIPTVEWSTPAVRTILGMQSDALEEISYDVYQEDKDSPNYDEDYDDNER